MPHPGKLRLRQGRWNLSELDSASSDGTSSCRASLVSVLSLHTCAHVRVQEHSHPHTHMHTHTITHCVLSFGIHLLLTSLQKLLILFSIYRTYTKLIRTKEILYVKYARYNIALSPLHLTESNLLKIKKTTNYIYF